MALQANIILSRPSYQAGTSVVGTVQITRTPNNEAKNNNNNATTTSSSPIRNEIVSARLYLAGRAYLGGNSRTGGKVSSSSRWRSMHEINQLKKIYGEHHACLTMAKMDETSWWQENNGNDDNDDCDLNNNSTKKTSFHKAVQTPQVTYIEQAERFAVHSFLHPSTSTSVKTNDNHTVHHNDYTNLPTPHENNTICFWMTNILELIDVPERHLDRTCTKCCAASTTDTASSSATDDNAANYQCHHLRPGRGKFYGDMHPYRPLQIPDLNVVREAWKDVENNKVEHKQQYGLEVEEVGQGGKSEEESSSNAVSALPSAWESIVASANNHASSDISAKDNNESSSSKTPLEHNQLALSFRANLPPNVPPTMSAECVKYFYSAVLVVTTAEGEVRGFT